MVLAKEIEQFVAENLSQLNFSFASVARIDFKQTTFSAKSFYLPEFQEISNDLIYDLASLTKPLSLGLAKLKYESLFDDDLNLLIHHMGGLPAYGALSKNSWKQHLKAFEIKKSDCLYSDYSALRAMIEFDQKHSESLERVCENFYQNDVIFWKKLNQVQKEQCVVTGVRKGQLIQGQVHDPNAFNISSFCSHAGFFATIEGLCRGILKLDTELGLLQKVNGRIDFQKRFVDAFDRVQNPRDTLAGVGCGEKTFGHLGFTGTSFWVDPSNQLGCVLLTNATESYWYERKFLHKMRRFIGQQIWSGSCFE